MSVFAIHDAFVTIMMYCILNYYYAWTIIMILFETIFQSYQIIYVWCICYVFVFLTILFFPKRTKTYFSMFIWCFLLLFLFGNFCSYCGGVRDIMLKILNDNIYTMKWTKIKSKKKHTNFTDNCKKFTLKETLSTIYHTYIIKKIFGFISLWVVYIQMNIPCIIITICFRYQMRLI